MRFSLQRDSLGIVDMHGDRECWGEFGRALSSHYLFVPTLIDDAINSEAIT
jgi:hypothetical protein